MLQHKNYFKSKRTSVNEQFVHYWIIHQTITTLLNAQGIPLVSLPDLALNWDELMNPLFCQEACFVLFIVHLSFDFSCYTFTFVCELVIFT